MKFIATGPASMILCSILFGVQIHLGCFISGSRIQEAHASHDHTGWYRVYGDDVGDQHSKLLTPSAANTSTSSLPLPGSRAGSAVWSDNHGNVLLFGGLGLDHRPTEEPHLMNDLWHLNVDDLKWDPKFATLEREREPVAEHDEGSDRRLPQPRYGAAACGVDGLVFVVFGGEGANGVPLYDTWLYSVRKSVWIPLYVHRAEAKATITHPSARAHAATWCAGDKLLVFGGVGPGGRTLDDLWEFSLRNLTWRNMTQAVDLLSLLATQASTGRLFPVGRSSPTTWVGQRGRALYLMGGVRESGLGIAALDSRIPVTALLSDNWAYFPGNESWVCLDPGSDPAAAPAAGGGPGGHCCGVAWTDIGGSLLWLYGGLRGSHRESVTRGGSPLYEMAVPSYDLRRYNLTSRTWSVAPSFNASDVTVLSGHRVRVEDGQRPSITARGSSASWECRGAKFLFGGRGLDGRGKLTYLNEVWTLITSEADSLNFLGTVFPKSRTSPLTFKLTPLMTFLVCLATIGGLVMVVGTAFCLKKFLWDYPRHTPGREYNVKYSPIQDEASLEFDSM